MSILLVVFACVFASFGFMYEDQGDALLSIVIDDFGGYVRNAVNEMVSLPIPLTCAIMPRLENTISDAELAYKNNHEIILHMPMEAHIKLPENWYGNVYIKNSDSDETAKDLVNQCLKEIPHCKGMNIHIGSGVCTNSKLMTAIMKTAKENNKYFLDSVTNQKTVCEKVAKCLTIDFAKRFEFLEKTGQHSYAYTKKILYDAVRHAKKYGSAIVIGHVGVEGGMSTYQAIKDNLDYIKSQGVKFVYTSQIIENIKMCSEFCI